MVILGGVGEVCTLPHWRGQGLATALLRKALLYMKENGVEISALHAASNALGLYASLGYASVPMPIHRCDVGDPQPLRRGHKIAMVDFEDDRAWDSTLQRFSSIHDAFCAAGLQCSRRAEEYWRNWVRFPAEALDSQGNETAGVMRGWELREDFVKMGSDPGAGVGAAGGVAYLIAKAAASFSAAYEADGVGSSDCPHASRSVVITVLDFASRSPPGSKESEVQLFQLLAAAKESFFPGEPWSRKRAMHLDSTATTRVVGLILGKYFILLVLTCRLHFPLLCRRCPDF